MHREGLKDPKAPVLTPVNRVITLDRLENPPSTPTTETLARMRDRVFERKVFLKNIIEKLGDKSLIDYVPGYCDVEMHPLTLSRQNEFLDTFEREVTETLGAEVAARGRTQLKKTFFGSTNDHHGPINAFDAFNAHLVLALSSMNDPIHHPMDAIIVFSCCNVSLNNISFPRGVLFQVDTPQGGAMRRLSLLPSNSHACALYGYRAYEPREIEKLQKLLRQHVREGTVPKHVAAKVERVITDVFGAPECMTRRTYSAQASIIDKKMWELVFEGQPKAPVMVNVGQERLVSRLLIDHHLQRDCVMKRFLFDSNYERLIRKHFDGIYGAFSSADNSGTYMFWGRAANGQRIQMIRTGDKLVSSDGSVSVDWNPEAVTEALKTKTLIPSILLVFTIFSFYYGLKCLGGYSQVNYLTFMKEAYINMMKELGETEAVEAAIPVSTKNWSGFTFSYIKDSKGTIMPAQFLDLYLYGTSDMWDCFMDYSKKLTLRESIQPLLPEMYRYSYSENEREADLLSLTPEAIAATTGIKPCLTLS